MNRCLRKHSSYRWHRILGAFVFSLMIAGTDIASASANVPGPVISIVVDGTGVMSGVSPVHQNGRMLVPIRVVAEATGSKVSYEPASEKVTLEKKGKHITLDIGSKTAYVDGKPFTMDVSPVIKNKRTIVPIRFISEALGFRVQWDEKSAVAYIQSKPVDDRDRSVNYTSNPYVVQPGDTLLKIASRHDTNMGAIKKNNQLTSDELLVDQILYLPEGAKQAKHSLAEKSGDDSLLGKQFRFPFQEDSRYETYGKR